LIELDRLTKSYGGLVAVHDLSLRVAEGEVYALLGANGAGKTTALRCLATLLQPTSGTARIAGFDAMREPLEVRRRLGFLAASMGLYQRLSARELLRYFANLNGLRGAAAEARIDEMVEAFDLGEFSERLCGKLSTGQRQRVSIARAILKDPAVLILDEATSSLDNESEALIEDALNHLLKGRTTLIIAHRLSTVRRADRLLVLDQGRIVEEGTHAELLAEGGLYARLYARQFRDDDAKPVDLLSDAEAVVEAAAG
jgi:sodium transport system ATP-binding protein